MPANPDAIVVGGGLIGCLAARALAADGLRVTLFEHGAELGRKASTAAAGMLSPQMEWAEGILVAGGDDGETARAQAMLELCIAARDRWPAFAAALEAEAGHSLRYRSEGTLVVALSEHESIRLEAQARSQQARGLRAEWLDAPAARRREPGLGPEALGALYLPDDHQVDPLLLMAAAIDALQRDGIRVETGTAVTAIDSAGGCVRGVRTAAASGGVAAREGMTSAPWVVLAAGAWSAGIAGLPRALAVHPVKGQMAALRPAEMPIRHVVGAGGAYCVPRDDGRIVVGATVEHAGFDEIVDPAATAALVAAVSAAVPALRYAPVDSRWTGLRPGTADDLPILGEDPELAGLLYATGHYRNGILLAPLTADLVVGWVRGVEPPLDLARFSAARNSTR